MAGELAHLGEKPGVTGCLIDIRGTTSVSSVIDKYEFAYNKATVSGVPRHWKVAFLKDRGDDSPNFIETVMKNAGFKLKIFEDESEAIDWLKGTLSS